MKRTLQIIFFSLFSFNSFSQIAVNWVEDYSQTFNGDTVYAYSTENAVGTDLYIVNQGPEETFIWRRVRLSVSGQGFTDELCDNMICHIPTGSDWTCQLPYTIPSGDSTLFQPKLLTNNMGGNAHFRYYILNSNEVPIDSVDVIFESTLNLHENMNKQVELNIYPNPAKEIINLELVNFDNPSTLVVVDALGKNFVSKKIFGNNKFMLKDLRKGIYFAKVYSEKEGVLITQKFVIH